MVQKNTGDQMYWLAKLVCYNSKEKKEYTEIVDTLLLPSQSPAQDQANFCDTEKGPIYPPFIIAVGRYDRTKPPARTNFNADRKYGWQFDKVDWAWQVAHEKFVQLSTDKITCIKYADSDFSPTPIPKVIVGEFSIKRALEVLYGDEGTVQVQGDKAFVRIDPPKYSTGIYPVAIEVLLTAPFRENNVDKYVVLTGTGPADMGAHSSSAQIDGAVFYRTNNTWQIDAEQQHITDMGSFGHAPNGQLVKIGPDKYGFQFNNTYMSTGIGGESISIFTALEKGFKEVFNAQTGYFDARYPDTANIEKEGYSSKVEFVPSNNPTYYDIKVTTQGTKLVDKKVIPFEEVKVYEFVGTKYELRKE